MLYLFDIDGTILWTGGAGSRALERVFVRRYGVTGAMEAVSPGGKTDWMIVTEMFRNTLHRDPTESELVAVIAEYEEILPEELAISEQFRLLPAVVEVLGEIGVLVGQGLGIATGNTREGARAKLEHAGLWERFFFGGFGCDSPVRAELVAAAIRRGNERLGREVDRGEVVVVGDTTRDVEAARACGVRAVAVATGHPTRDELEESGPDVVLDSLAELPAWHRAVFSDRASSG